MTQPEGQPTTMTVREQTDLNSWWAEIVHEAFDKFYPKQEGGSEERSNALAVQGVLAIKMIPAIESLISNAKEEGKKETAAEVAPFLITLRVLNKESEDLSYSIDKWIAKHVLSSNNPKP